MTQGLEGSQQTTGGSEAIGDLAVRGTEIGEQAAGVAEALAAARGSAPDEVLDEVGAAVEKATARLRLSARHTVVAIAGATGSGKSSTYNALTGLELSSVGIRRPTTSWATALVWGSEGADDLLQWLGIPPRHQTMRDSMLDNGRGGDDRDLDGVVLLDLPDHDSTEVSHHLEVDRLVAVADLMIWVLDPQKYADAAVHDRYFKKLTTHQDVMLVALNHIDTVPADRRDAMLADVRRLLAEDGLTQVPVLGISAKEGIGLDTLRSEIRRRAEGKAAATARVRADVTAAVGRLEQAAGDLPARELPTQRVRDLEDAVAEAAGVTAVVETIERVVATKSRSAVAWPPLALLSRGGEESRHEPALSTVDRAGVDTAVRGLADEVAESVGPGWATRVRSNVAQRLTPLGDRLDRELRAVPLTGRLPFWVGGLRVLHWLLFLGALGAAGWWVATQVGDSTVREVAGLPLPAALAIAGLVAGLVLAVVGRLLVSNLATRRADDADERLREIVHDVVAAEVVAPIAPEVASYAAYRRGIERARR